MAAYELNASYTDVGEGFVEEAAKTLLGSYSRIEHCLKQLNNQQLWWRPRPEMNSIANLMLHLAGNVEQWIIAPIENRPAVRNRPAEFAERGPIAKVEVQETLANAVGRSAGAIRSLTGAEALLTACRVQGHDTNILAAVFHSVTHFEGHAQEIISMTRQQLGSDYQFLWTPKSPEQISA